ncbi:TPR repeat containing exported protein; Putative periplasmic protein contains a protein prenylyltransferase domain [hydrothermal vent metagenome]|uniref:TPR repeat containing exported protein Putative periplasmic protein contains a protein prenylyltransferase domain n=1 Tax=hydrothermal vent metagenome TaxID=652676 RepID=A0A3B0YP68_9ZZZZ
MSVTKNGVTAVLLALSANVPAAGNADLGTRVQQLERKLDSRGLMDMQGQVTALQREVQQLRGEIEVQTHTLKNLQKRQRDLYLDIDRRLYRLEAGGATPQPTSSRGTATSGAAVSGLAASATASVAAIATLSPADQRKAYDQAFELLKEGRYTDASAAFQLFLKTYPDSSYADNAQYWLGEVYYVTRQFKQALSEFDKVLTQHSGSSKSADARLKMGYIFYEQKDWAKARKALEQVIKDFPGSTSAKLARERLDLIQ